VRAYRTLRHRTPTHRTLIVSVSVAAILALTLTGPVSAGAAPKRLVIAGSTSMLTLVQKLAAAYHKAYKKIPEPKVEGGQTGIGIDDVAAGRVDIGDASRDPIRGVDPPGLVFSKIARDGVCVITNTANSLTNLSHETIVDIFTGDARDWSEVPGAKISGPIDLFDREAVSGTQDAFQDIFLGEELKISPSATQESSEGQEVSAVGGDKSAIGFTSFAATLNGGVHTVDYEGIPCTLANAKSGQYAGVRNFWMVTKGAPKDEAAKFIDWITKPCNLTVRKIVSSEWIAIH
jgi:phosphate transport system substrate-binding protein